MEEQHDEWDDLVLDEDFVRSAEIREPAGRTRMLAALWRRQPPKAQPWRSDAPERRRRRWWR